MDSRISRSTLAVVATIVTLGLATAARADVITQWNTQVFASAGPQIQRTLAKKDPTAPHETLLVVDATTGSNALNQAREFHKAVGGLTGLIVTKLDGSGKGGVIVSIQQELGIPTRFIGTGEEVEAFELFSPERFLDKIF